MGEEIGEFGEGVGVVEIVGVDDGKGLIGEGVVCVLCGVVGVLGFFVVGGDGVFRW